MPLMRDHSKWTKYWKLKPTYMGLCECDVVRHKCGPQIEPTIMRVCVCGGVWNGIQKPKPFQVFCIRVNQKETGQMKMHVNGNGRIITLCFKIHFSQIKGKHGKIMRLDLQIEDMCKDVLRVT